MKINQNYQEILDGAEPLYTNVQISKITDDLSKAITNELENTNPIVMPIMIGGLIFSGQLIPKLNFPLEIDYVHATRY